MRRADTWVLAGLAALAAWLLAPALFGGQVPYYRDVAISDLPQVAYLFRTLLEGQMPVWNPLSGGGYPQLAGLQPPFLYPLQGAFLPAAAGWAGWGRCLAWYLWLHYLLAGAGTYALCRWWRWSRPAALAAAAAFEASGYLVSLHNLFTNLPPAALLPLLALLYDRLLARPGGRSFAALALLLGLQVASGRPDVVLMTLMYLGVWGLWRGGQARSWPAAARSLGLLAAAALLAGLLNAAMLLPAREFVAASNRAGGIAFAEMTANSFSPALFPALLLPAFYGSVEHGSDWGRFFVTEADVNFTLYYLTLYGGITAYLLALLARSPAGQRGLVPFLWAVWTAALLLAMGRHLPLYAWFTHLPLANYIRYPMKFFYLWAWAVALLAGLGLEAARAGLPGRWRALAAAWAALALSLAALWLGRDAALAGLADLDFQRWATDPAATHVNAAMRRLLPAIWPAALGLAWLAWSWGAVALALIRFIPARPAVPWLLAGLLASDLLVHNTPAVYFADKSLFEPPLLARYLQAHAGDPPARVVRPYGDGFRLGRRRDREAELAAVERPTAYEYRQSLEGLAFNTSQMFGVAGISVYGSLRLTVSSASLLEYLYPRPVGGVELAPGDSRLDRFARVIGAANIGYVLVPVTPRPGAGPEQPPHLRGNPNLVLAWQDGRGLFLYRNHHLLPRSYLVPEAAVTPDLAAAARTMDAQAMLLHQRAVLVDDQALRETLRLRATLPRRAPGVPRSCEVTRYATTAVDVATSSPESGYLVLADNYYPGWIATVDGRERPIMLANGFARGVYVEAGRHQVAFRYRPRSLALGLAISLLALLTLVLLASWRRDKRAC